MTVHEHFLASATVKGQSGAIEQKQAETCHKGGAEMNPYDSHVWYTETLNPSVIFALCTKYLGKGFAHVT